MLKNYDLFIFDWDGTLSEMHAVLRANEWLKRALGTWRRRANTRDIEADRGNLKRAIEVEETKNEMLAAIFEALSAFYRPRLHRDVASLLVLLKRRGKKVAMLSNGEGGRISNELKKMGIRKYFDIVVSAKDLGLIKPDPRGVRLITSRMKARPSRTLYLGDMIDDVLTADLAGVGSCAVSDGFDSHAKLKSAEPKYLFRSIEEMFLQMSR
jgi:HAD superfamily hydrolase (TIGR01509 family)